MAFLALGVVYSLWADPIWPAYARPSLGLGFWLWTSSLFVAAIALQLRARHLKPVQRAELSSVSNEGALQ